LFHTLRTLIIIEIYIENGEISLPHMPYNISKT